MTSTLYTSYLSLNSYNNGLFTKFRNAYAILKKDATWHGCRVID